MSGHLSHYPPWHVRRRLSRKKRLEELQKVAFWQGRMKEVASGSHEHADVLFKMACENFRDACEAADFEAILSITQSDTEQQEMRQNLTRLAMVQNSEDIESQGD